MNVPRLFALLIVSAAWGAAYAQPSAKPSTPVQPPAQSVAAMVNGEIISQHDLEQRTKLALLSSNLPDTPEMRTQVQGSLLHRLIDEDLKIQSATKERITISASDIQAQIEALDQQNHFPAGGVAKLLAGKGIELDALRQQIRAEIAWSALVHHVLTRRVHVSDNAIQTRLDAIRANFGKPEYRVGELFLSLDDPKDEPQVRDLAERLSEQMHQGAPFTAIAHQFNQGGTPDGNLGWVSEGMLDDELIKSLEGLQVNGVTAPVRTIDGYYILSLLEKRKVGEGLDNGATIDLLAIDLGSLASAGQAERDMQMRHLREFLAPAKNCDDLASLSKQAPSASVTTMDKMLEGQLPMQVRPLIKDLAPGQISEPIDTPKGRRFFAVCGRATGNSDGLPSADDIRQRMEDEQLELVARHFMIDLHSDAVIDIRQ